MLPVASSSSRRGETRRSKLRRVIVPVTCNLLQFQFEVSTLPEVKGVDGSLIFKLRLHCFHDLIKDLLAKLIQEDTTFVLRVGLVLDNIDVGVEGQFTLLLTNSVLIRLKTSVPELTVECTDTGSLPPMVVREFSMYHPPGPWKAWENNFAQGRSSLV